MAKRVTNTPLLNAWRERLNQATEGYGLKSKLAKHMATLRDQPVKTWTVNISRYLRTTQSPHAEDLLAITQWMDSRTD